MPNMQNAAVKLVTSLTEIPTEAWDACANPAGAAFHPFVAHGFLKALEDAGCIGARSGWIARHLVLENAQGEIRGVAPGYVKTHSQGEYVFDHAWADAYRRAGGQYYPKYQIAVPFTPVPGPRLLVMPGMTALADEAMLAAAAVEVAQRNGLSSVHVTFESGAVQERLADLGYLARTGQQFHWLNRDYRTFDDFLATLASRKRKAVRKERIEALAAGLEIEWVTGAQITEAHWDQMFAFYMDTGSRKWGQPYLNREFFSRLGAAMADRCLLVLAKRNHRFVAGALNLIGGDCLYGRYWGAIEHHPGLHFEVCYYQAIDFAIAHNLARVEAGAQGDHKLARGYLPVTTYSSHWIANASLREAVAHYLAHERETIAEINVELEELGPYRKA